MEKVFAVATDKISTIVPTGVHPANETQLLDFVNQKGAFYDRTDELENNTTLKQIIPYVTATCAGKILVYQRTPKQTEKRLHAKYSIGFGGHINPEDGENGQNPVIGARTRELNEEVSLEGTPTYKFEGTINFNDTPVESVHLGFAYTAEFASEKYTINEEGYFASTAWMTPQQIGEIYDGMEKWSQALFAELYPQHVPATAKA